MDTILRGWQELNSNCTAVNVENEFFKYFQSCHGWFDSAGWILDQISQPFFSIFRMRTVRDVYGIWNFTELDL